MSHSDPGGVVASVAVAPLLDGPARPLRVVHRSRLVWQLADDRHRVVCCLTLPGALRLPHAVACRQFPPPTSTVLVGGGLVAVGSDRHTVRRWWVPAAPRHPRLLRLVDDDAAAATARHWRQQIGGGPGLTPYADDVLVGTLVTLLAAGHPVAASLATDVASAPLERLTTAASAGLLRQAARGVCLDELAAVLAAYVGEGGDRMAAVDVAERRLLAVGHSSGRGLLHGVRRMVGHHRPNSTRCRTTMAV